MRNYLLIGRNNTNIARQEIQVGSCVKIEAAGAAMIDGKVVAMITLLRLKSNSLWIIVIAFFFISLKQVQSEQIKESKETDKWGQEVDGKAISIRTDKASYAPEEQIQLYITFKNVGKEPLETRFEGNPFLNYEISVSDPKGEETKLTTYGRQAAISKSLGWSTASRTLEPGKDISMKLSISRIYDFSVAKNYTIIVHKSFIADKQRPVKIEKVISNKLEITVDDHLSKE